ncbi:unnamed protein product [Paramecium sonneborni]|uniref:Uncharacterized protein n=1 Tax=Paramecium sonneborni TaxID=65129 RepID=A0A8S1QVD9_9CILI|nr:unnamed protein product [Paramecium sonneborni]
MNNEFDSDESINSDEAIKTIDFKYLTPNFHHELDDKGTSLYKRMNGINTLMVKSTNQVSTSNMQTQSRQQLNHTLENLKQTEIHLSNSRRRYNSRNQVDKQSQNRLNKNSYKLQTNIISPRKPKRQIYVTQIVNKNNNDLNSLSFSYPQRISRILANNDCMQSQKGSSASSQKGILKSSSFEVLKIGGRLSMQSLNSPMMRPSNKQVSFEFTSEQMRKLRNHNISIDPKKYSRLKTKFQK